MKKQRQVEALFKDCPDDEAKYQRIIQLGRGLPRLDEKHRIADNLVQGCQSKMYLHSYKEGDRVRFEAESDALISAGLAAMLIQAYDGETPEAVLKCPPEFLARLKLSLTPSRANGLHSLHLRMQQDALKHLLK